MCLGLWSRGKKLGWTLQNLDCSSRFILWLKERALWEDVSCHAETVLLRPRILTPYIMPEVQMFLRADTLVFSVGIQPQSPGWQVQSRAHRPPGHHLGLVFSTESLTLIISPLTPLPFPSVLPSWPVSPVRVLRLSLQIVWLVTKQTNGWIFILFQCLNTGMDEMWCSEFQDLLLKPHKTTLRFWTPLTHTFLGCAHWFASHPWGR